MEREHREGISRIKISCAKAGINMETDLRNTSLTEKSSPPLEFFKKLISHPFILSAFVCFSCTTLTLPVELWLVRFIWTAAAFAMIWCGIVFFAAKKMAEQSRTVYGITMSVFGVVFGLIFSYIIKDSAYPYMLILNTGLLFAAAAAIYLWRSGQATTKRFCVLLTFAGFLIRLAFIMRFSIRNYQHDAGSIESMKGHIGYIAYLLENKHLPDFDVRTVYQFYHPPLHHGIAALWVGLQELIGIPEELAFENIQILTLFYSCLCMILAYKLFRALGLKGFGLAAAQAIVAFCPTLYIFAASVNNDPLLLVFTLAALLNCLKWYESRSYGRMICTAFCMGFAMMAKLSGWMIAPAIAFIFIFAFFKDLKNWKRYILHFLSFLFISVPLALWWEIRNLIIYDVPMNYVLKFSETISQYIGNEPISKRLFDFSAYQFSNPAEQFIQYDGAYNEFNPLVGLFKTSVFDELFVQSRFSNVGELGHELLWAAIALGIAGFLSMIYTFVKDKAMPLHHKLFTAIIYTVYFVLYYYFCITYPHVCTQNIRYAVPLIILGAYFTGRVIMLPKGRKKQQRKNSFVSKLLCGLTTALYCVFSIIYYELIIIPG